MRLDRRGKWATGRTNRWRLRSPFSCLVPATRRLEPGLWEIRSIPGAATLDGKVLDDLPLGESRTERVCLAAAQAADPAAFFARDTQQDCKITRSNTAAGRVDISGSCPSPEDGSDGTMKLSGRYSSDSYELELATAPRTSRER